MTQLSRQGVILELARQAPVPSQDELRRELNKRGFNVTQATLSRDIHKLGLVKLPQGYTLPQAVTTMPNPAPVPAGKVVSRLCPGGARGAKPAGRKDHRRQRAIGGGGLGRGGMAGTGGYGGRGRHHSGDLYR